MDVSERLKLQSQVHRPTNKVFTAPNSHWKPTARSRRAEICTFDFWLGSATQSCSAPRPESRKGSRISTGFFDKTHERPLPPCDGQEPQTAAHSKSRRLGVQLHEDLHLGAGRIEKRPESLLDDVVDGNRFVDQALYRQAPALDHGIDPWPQRRRITQGPL